MLDPGAALPPFKGATKKAPDLARPGVKGLRSPSGVINVNPDFKPWLPNTVDGQNLLRTS